MGDKMTLYEAVIKLYPDADHPIRHHLAAHPNIEANWKAEWGSRLTPEEWRERLFRRLQYIPDPSPILLTIRDDLYKLIRR